MILFLWGVAWTWAVVFGYFAQDFALPLIGLNALDFWAYAWLSLITLVAGLPLAAFKALAD